MSHKFKLPFVKFLSKILDEKETNGEGDGYDDDLTFGENLKNLLELDDLDDVKIDTVDQLTTIFITINDIDNATWFVMSYGDMIID